MDIKVPHTIKRGIPRNRSVSFKGFGELASLDGNYDSFRSLKKALEEVKDVRAMFFGSFCGDSSRKDTLFVIGKDRDYHLAEESLRNGTYVERYGNLYFTD